MSKILIVNKYFAPDIGGVETVVRQYADWLTSSGEHDVVVLCCSKTLSLRTRVSSHKGIKIVRCSSFGSLMGMPISFSFFYWFVYFSAWARVVNIHYPFPLADIAALVTPKFYKLLYTVHANISGKGRLGNIFKKLSVFSLRKADYLALTSESLSKIFFPFLSIPRAVIPLCLSAGDKAGGRSKSLPFSLPLEYGLYFGRFAHYKGLDVLMKAAEMRVSKQIPIVIAGHGPLSDDLKNILSSNSRIENVFLFDHIFTEDEKFEILSRANFLIFPSTTEAEAFGIIQLEALSCGLPVINTYLGTGVEWVSLDQVTGITVQPNDVKGLADAIDQIALDEPLRTCFSHAARARVQMFSEDVVKAKVLMLFQQL